ncbi:MAG TPA: hypothetical protein VKG23_14175 [Thermoanaerobaculia bacterium]|jgi:ribosomal protein L16/L10AE|nr:hypothetical protein [Thermoanaerobaculia bacterium]
MRTIRSIGVLLGVLVLCGDLAAGSPDKEKTKTHGFSVAGLVARTDETAHTFVVRTPAGKETTLVRTSATKLNGKALAAGDRVAVRYLERDGKKIATSIRIEPPVVATATATPVAPASTTR